MYSFNSTDGWYEGRPVASGSTPQNRSPARSSPPTKTSITRTGLSSQIQSSRHSGNRVLCPRSIPSTKRFIRSLRKSRRNHTARIASTHAFLHSQGRFRRFDCGPANDRSWARLGPSVKSAIRSLWDGKATLRKPYSTSSMYEYARWQTGLTARPVSKFPAPHFESPTSGEEPHHGDLYVRPIAQGPRPPGGFRVFRPEGRHVGMR